MERSVRCATTVPLHNRRPSTSRPPEPARIYVTIVSKNPETIHGLESYLRGAGVPSHCARALRDIDAVAPACATAAVIFPDDFESADVLAFMRHLRGARPRLLALLVTREPGRFQAVAGGDGRSLPPLVLPRPSFGWDILDAIRAHAETALEPT